VLFRSIAKEYGRRGYIALETIPVPAFDDAGHTVTFEIAVKEGDQYRMGTLLTPGVGEEIAARIRSHWTLKAGDVFDAEYPAEFARNMAVREARSSPALGALKVSVAPGRVARTVDVTVTGS
jgi:outer membrane protein assembly factor BamA